ncbi:unnamed protein product [Sympodiomycopsis kandeliae]
MSFTNQRNYPRHILNPIEQEDGSSKPSVKLSSKIHTPQWASKAGFHVFPAAYPRRSNASHPRENHTEEPVKDPNPKYDHMYDSRTAQERSGDDATYTAVVPASGGARDPERWMAARRLVPLQSRPSGISILCMPGMGMTQEMMDPLLTLTLDKLNNQNIAVREIWTLDIYSSGRNALLNPVGAALADEKDSARDILAFVAMYLPTEVTSELPYRLQPRKIKKGDQPIQLRRDLFFLGHSLSAQGALLVSAHAPQLFRGLIVLDPPVVPAGKILGAFAKFPSDVFVVGLNESKVKDSESARELVQKSRRSQGWTSEAIEIFLHTGFRPDGSWRLVMRPNNEYLTYHDKETPSHTFDRLRDVIRPLLWISPEKPFAIPAPLMPKLLPGQQVVMMKGVTHSLPYEKPEPIAVEAAGWIARQMLHDKRKSGTERVKL